MAWHYKGPAQMLDRLSKMVIEQPFKLSVIKKTYLILSNGQTNDCMNYKTKLLVKIIEIPFSNVYCPFTYYKHPDQIACSEALQYISMWACDVNRVSIVNITCV